MRWTIVIVGVSDGRGELDGPFKFDAAAGELGYDDESIEGCDRVNRPIHLSSNRCCESLKCRIAHPMVYN